MPTQDSSVTNQGPEIQRWTAKRKAAVVLELLRGKTTAAEVARQHDLTVAEVEAWREAFLASYFGHSFTDSWVWASRDPRGGRKAGFVSADRELGEWLAFPRDKRAAEVIGDGRWALEPHPLEWTLMPSFAQPLAIRRDPRAGITVIVMTRRDDCFGVFTPYSEEKHISNYMSLFGHDLEVGETARARSRLVVLPDPTEAEILRTADAFLGASP